MALSGSTLNSTSTLNNSKPQSTAVTGAQTAADYEALNKRYQEQVRRNAEQQYQEQADAAQHQQEEYDNLQRETDELNTQNSILSRKAEAFNSVVDRYNSASAEEKEAIEPELRLAAQEYNSALESRNRQAEVFNMALESAKNAGAVSQDNQPVQYDNEPVDISIHKSTVVYDNSPDPELLTNLENRAQDVKQNAADYEQKGTELNELITRFNSAGSAEEQATLREEITVKADEYNESGRTLQQSVSVYNTALDDAKAGGAVTSDSIGIDWSFEEYNPSYTHIEQEQSSPAVNVDDNLLFQTGFSKSVGNVTAIADMVKGGIPSVTESISNAASGFGSTGKILSLFSVLGAVEATRKGDTATAEGLMADATTFAAISHAGETVTNKVIGDVQTVQHTPEQEELDQANMFAEREDFLKTVNAPEWLIEQNTQAKNYYTEGLVSFDSENNVKINPPDIFTSGAVTLVTIGVGGAAATAIKATGAGIGRIAFSGGTTAIEGAAVSGVGGASGTGTAVITATEAETVAKLGAIGAFGSMLDTVQKNQTKVDTHTINATSEMYAVNDDYSGVYNKWRELRKKNVVDTHTTTPTTYLSNDTNISQRINNAESVSSYLRSFSQTSAGVEYGDIVEIPTSNKNSAIYEGAEINLLRWNSRNSEENADKVRDENAERFRFNYDTQFRFNTEYELKSMRIPDINWQKKKKAGGKKKKRTDDDYYLKVRSVITPKDLLGTRNKLLEATKKSSKDLFTVKKRRK